VIGYVRQLLDELVLAPQNDPAAVPDRTRRAVLDATESPIDVEASELDTLALRSTPVAADLAGGITVRHELDVAVAVRHGDPLEAIRLRDLIVLDLVMRFRAADFVNVAPDLETGQQVTRGTWAVDYRPLGLEDTRETATLTFTFDVEIDG